MTESDRGSANLSSSTPSSTGEPINRRRQPRKEFGALVGLVLLNEGGSLGEPMVLRSRDLSTGGMGLMGRLPIATGALGVLQIVRADNHIALMGVEIRYCRYVEDQGHDIGVQFRDMPPGVSTSDFLNEDRTIRLFDPLLVPPTQD